MLPPNIQRHHGGYRARVVVDGRRRVSRSYPTPQQAEKAARALRALRGDGGATLGSAIEAVRSDLAASGRSAGTVSYYEGQWRAIQSVLGGSTRLAAITPEVLRQFVAKRRLQGAGDSAIAKNLAALGRVFRQAIRDGIAEDNPVARVSRPTVRVQRHPSMTAEEVEAALARVTNVSHRDLFELVYRTGLRRSEAARLRPEDVDLDRGCLRVQGKAGDATLRIAHRLRPVLARMLERGDLPMSADLVRRRFAWWRKRLGEPRWKAHSLRHSCATALVAAGVPVQEVQRVLRHRTLAMTLRYFHGTDEAQQQAVDSI